MKRDVKKSIVVVFVCILPLTFQAREKRDLLTQTYSEQVVSQVLIKDVSWVSYPAYHDRAGWERVPQSLRGQYIRDGEKYLGYDWPQVKATEYLEFMRTGDRQVMERPQNQRRQALQTLVFAELMEGKGRFIDDIVNGVFTFCEQTYWGASAHFYMYRPNGGAGTVSSNDPATDFPDIDNPIVDLVVGEIACDLAWIWYYFHDEFDKISPRIAKRLKDEIMRKVVNPYYERMDYWWITGWGRGSVNNWTPWCNFNVLNCIMLLEDDPAKMVKGVHKTMASVDLFFNAYPDDGACDEGPSYWGVAGGKAFDYLNFLSEVTGGKINLFDNTLVKDIGRYIYKVYISQGCYFTNFADAPAKISPRAGAIYRYGQKITDEPMQAFGAFLLRNQHYGQEPDFGAIGLTLEDLFGLEGWKKKQATEPLLADYYFPDMQIAIARDKAGTTDGFYLAAKGGSNGEGHNHNDVGSCIVFYNANPVLVDAGVGTYTKQTFSNERYQIWTMQSTWHNLPLINGVAQSPGGDFKASGAQYKATRTQVSFSSDIAGAYPESAQVEKWVRGYLLTRNKGIAITDNFRLKTVAGKTELHFLTPLDCTISKPGVVTLKGEGFELQMTYPVSAMTARIEQKEMDDARLRSLWGSALTMLVFDLKEAKAGNVRIDIRRQFR
ncbi:MAG: heparinase II/III-family protein [Tannerella sp.]|jgi:hypothetical protein|nr:heparinase II/III-family protein [Tannerella sp.]